jgi:4-hydroxybenzoate polyprenyltransferase
MPSNIARGRSNKEWYTQIQSRITEFNLKKTIKGLLKLTRFDEYVYFVLITTLLGVAAAKGSFDWHMLILLPANWLAVGFAFMINDIEDAPDDALSSNKINRNPVSAGMITPKTARIWTFIVGVVSAVLFAFLGTWPFIFGLISLILGYLYSARSVRLKTIAALDILSHCLMLAGLQYLTGYFTYADRFNRIWFWPFAFVVSISIYGELYNEIRDIKGDSAANLRHTAIVLGSKVSHGLMLVILIFGIFAGFISFIVIDLIPFWVFIIMAVLAALFIIPPMLKVRRGDSSIAIQGAFQKPLEHAAALALILQYLLPWLNDVLHLGLF